LDCRLDFWAKLRAALRIAGVDLLPLWPLISHTGESLIFTLPIAVDGDRPSEKVEG
jgi:hypothetical protein